MQQALVAPGRARKGASPIAPELLAHLPREVVAFGGGVVPVDVHGTLAEQIIAAVPAESTGERQQDVHHHFGGPSGPDQRGDSMGQPVS